MTPEGKLIAECKKFLKGVPQCEFRKVHGDMFTVGEPDLDIVYRGISIKAEAKAPGSKSGATAHQKMRIKEWRIAGAVAFTFRTVGALSRTLDMIDEALGDLHLDVEYVEDYTTEGVVAIRLAGAAPRH